MNIFTKVSSLNNPHEQFKLIEVEYNIHNSSNQRINTTTTTTRPMFNMRIKPFKTVILFLIILTVLIFIYYPQDNVFQSLFIDKSTHRYSIIIDAGSTGSRIHVFRLRKNDGAVNSAMPYTLINEDLFHSIKPGLSSYAEEPHKAADSIKPLLDMAVTKIPSSLHGKTRISLKATAGLRLISETRANAILKSVEKLFSNYPFYTTANDVSVLDGTYEGIYSWLTLNYAKNTFHERKETETCALDLGGGSTQVTFIPTDQTGIATMKPQNIIDFKLDKVLYKIYTESFLGYGVMSARMSIFEIEKKNVRKNSTTSNAVDDNDDKNTLSSVCVESRTSIKWTQQNVEYTVKGIPGKERNFVDCLNEIEKLFEKNKLNAPVELRNKQIYAFSFYYDRISSAKLISPDGGLIKIEDLFIRAKEVCDNKHRIGSDTKDIEFFCMDLTYIYALLTHGLGLNLNQIINVYKEINSMEISWALGAAFHMLNDN